MVISFLALLHFPVDYYPNPLFKSFFFDPLSSRNSWDWISAMMSKGTQLSTSFSLIWAESTNLSVGGNQRVQRKDRIIFCNLSRFINRRLCCFYFIPQ